MNFFHCNLFREFFYRGLSNFFLRQLWPSNFFPGEGPPISFSRFPLPPLAPTRSAMVVPLKRLKFNFPILILGIWGWSKRARKHYPREVNLFGPIMVSEISVVVKKIEAATCGSVGNGLPQIFRINPSIVQQCSIRLRLLGVHTLLKKV